MKRLFVAGLAVTALLGGSANAADLTRPVLVYQPAAVAYFTWTGCYVGGNVGGVWANIAWNALGADLGSNTAAGLVGGAQGGCNYQVGSWVFGLVGDYDWTNIDSNGTNFLVAGLSEQTRIRSLASIAGRVGYAWDRFLGYVKAGGATVERQYNFLFGAGTLATLDERRGGWSIGIGGEYAFLDWLTGFVEYDYYKLGPGGNMFACTACGLFASTVPFNVTTNINIFKVGLNFTMPDDWDPQRSKSRPRG
jgi:outer membrane immunogenic protein